MLTKIFMFIYHQKRIQNKRIQTYTYISEFQKIFDNHVITVFLPVNLAPSGAVPTPTLGTDPCRVVRPDNWISPHLQIT